jgi:hypothetical protein
MIKIIITRKGCSLDKDNEIMDTVEKIAREHFPERKVEIIPNFTKHHFEDANIKIISTEDEPLQLIDTQKRVKVALLDLKVPSRNSYSRYRFEVTISIQPSKLFRNF